MMTYSAFLIVCVIIHALLNFDIFRKKATVNLPAIKSYRVFVVSIGIYFIADLFWGIFEENKLAVALYVDTTFYFVLMGFTILAWTNYIVKYVGGKRWFEKITLYFGNLFFLAEIVLLVINIFVPVLFKVDFETCVYKSFLARNIMLYVQILMYSLVFVYSLVMAFKSSGSKRARFVAISSYSLIMATSITIQIFDPYLPLYSIGCIIGSCVINSFVINGIKEEYKSALEQSRVLVRQGQKELTETKFIAYTDPLTGVKNKHAYVEEEDRIDLLISRGEMEDFAVIVFDLNGLKHVNDTKGHDAGDVYITDSCDVIKRFLPKTTIYRFGGDEFVAILTGDAYINRSEIMSEFEKYIDSCLNTDKPIISSGMSKYKKGVDNTYHAVFYRADKIMYSRKEVLKEHTNN